MSKNFRSSFIDLLCCHYQRQNLFGISESLRNRYMSGDDNNNNKKNSLYRKTDCLVQISDVTRFSQLTPIITASRTTTSSSSPPTTNELTPMYSSNDERKTSTKQTHLYHLSVYSSETHRQPKQSD